MNIFEQVASKNPKCDICGSGLIIMYGNGWDNDIMYCTDSECGAEYLFPTTTDVLYMQCKDKYMFPISEGNDSEYLEDSIERMRVYTEKNPRVCINLEGWDEH